MEKPVYLLLSVVMHWFSPVRINQRGRFGFSSVFGVSLENLVMNLRLTEFMLV